MVLSVYLDGAVQKKLTRLSGVKGVELSDWSISCDARILSWLRSVLTGEVMPSRASKVAKERLQNHLDHEVESSCGHGPASFAIGDVLQGRPLLTE